MRHIKLYFSPILILISLCVNAADYPSLEAGQTHWIGQQIFSNECNQQIDCLTAWNAGENFPSLGIGHFIWFRTGQNEPFQQSFPALLHFLEERSIAIPEWIVIENYASPWATREDFLYDFESPRLSELRRFLQKHIPEQVDFIVQRFEQSLTKVRLASPEHEKAIIEENFIQVANSSVPYGLYSLIDYVNFKGEGISPLEQYNGQGWGLRHVLRNMSTEGNDPLVLFVNSAKEVLTTRVANAPVDRNELRWLPGWENRLDTYLPTLPTTTRKKNQ